jgi:hypothetical protein
MSEPGDRWERLDRPAVPYTRPLVRVLAAGWLVAGIVFASQVRLPDLPPSPPPPRQPAATCWLVQVATRPAQAPALARDLRRLHRAGLPATVRPGPRPGARLLVVPTRTQDAAKAARAKAVRLGFPRSTLKRLPAGACRDRPTATPGQDRVE